MNSREAQIKLQQYGYNEIAATPIPTRLEIFIKQFASPMVLLLLSACAITLLLKDWHDAAVIFLAAWINGVVGFFQENKATREIEALKKMLDPRVKVIRDGGEKIISARELVQGDLVIIASGEKIPADGVLREAYGLQVSEAILTGESAPVEKAVEAKVFMGTDVLVGRGLLLVQATGAATEMGKVAEMLKATKNAPTPLQEKMEKLARDLTLISIIVSVIVFLILSLNGHSLLESFTVGIALAVAAIPEGLTISLTVVFALGMRRIFQRRALVRSLLAAETLGAVTVIATDKTGTLTEGKMRVTAVESTEPDQLLLASVLANNLLTPTETAIWEWGQSLGHTDPQKIFDENPRLAEIPFSSDQKYMATLNQLKVSAQGGSAFGGQSAKLKVGEGQEREQHAIFVKGAPDVLLEWCKLPLSERQAWEEKISRHSRTGLRLLGLAVKELAQPGAGVKLELASELGSGFKFLGLLGLADPVRAEVKNTLAEVARAGVRTVVLTGDYRETAEALLGQLGWKLRPEEIIEGRELEKIDVATLAQRLKTVRLFARITPSDKLKIVEAFQLSGEVVAMTGDGVNDAPALKKADIGVVVEPAAEVARAVGDLILIDSNYSTIVAAIEEGRSIFENSRKVILYLFSNSLIEVVTIIGAIALGLPLPLTAAQILWINLIHDILPALALTFEPKDPNLLREKPRTRQEGLINGRMRLAITSLNLIVPAFLLLGFFLFYRETKDLALAQTVTFTLLTFSVLASVFSVRSLKQPLWRLNHFSNPFLIGSVVIGLVILTVALTFTPLREFLGLTVLTAPAWLYVLGATMAIIFLLELAKLTVLRRHSSER